MATVGKTCIVEDLLAVPGHGMRRELVLGEVVEAPHPSRRHGELVATLCWLVQQSVRDPKAARVVASHPVRVGSDPDSLPTADVSVFVGAPDAQPYSSTSYSTDVPALVFEVVDDWDNAYLWHDKMTLFPRSGVAATISVWPNSRKVTVFSPDMTGRDLRADEQLDLSAIVPDVRYPVAAIFE